MLGFLWLFMVSTIITTNMPSSVYNLYVQIGEKNKYDKHLSHALLHVGKEAKTEADNSKGRRKNK